MAGVLRTRKSQRAATPRNAYHAGGRKPFWKCNRRWKRLVIPLKNIWCPHWATAPGKVLATGLRLWPN